MHTKITHSLFLTIAWFLNLLIVCENAAGQRRDSLSLEVMAVSARPSADSVTLRWAPLDYNVWRLANRAGYRIERFTISRNGSLLRTREKIVLENAVRPYVESRWVGLVQQNKYAAIAAQALFGERFEIDLRQTDVFAIVNKVRENEQRFAFALFSADMAPSVAKASGLWLTDTNVKKGERYLYRIIINSPDSLRGSIFVGPDDPYELPEPTNLQADFNDNFVSLKWPKIEVSHYTAYILERSEDGKIFNRISDSPLITVTPTAEADSRYEYASDSLGNLTTTYHYRVRGLSPFGEAGPASNVVSGTGRPVVEQVPFITSAVSPQNTVIDIHWDFPAHNNNAIKGFEVRRAPRPDGQYASLSNGLLHAHTRNFLDTSPHQSNYYKVLALGLDGQWYTSHVYYAQLVDSIPPLPPTGVKAKVGDDGKVIIAWNANHEEDIFGYRVYKAYHLSEELAQVTSEPVKETFLTDFVELETLNDNLYYCVMSIDRNQNHSALSDPLRVSLPDKVRPLPPVIVSHHSGDSGICISWRSGPSTDIVKHKIYRHIGGTTQWLEIKALIAGHDPVYRYQDTFLEPGQKYFYTITSVDDAGLESAPTPPVSGSIPLNGLRPAIKWKKSRINREENILTLLWDYPESNVQSFKIYRSQSEQPMVMFQTVDGDHQTFDDIIIPGKTYKYRVMALFTNGQRSSLSEELMFTY